MHGSGIRSTYKVCIILADRVKTPIELISFSHFRLNSGADRSQARRAHKSPLGVSGFNGKLSSDSACLGFAVGLLS
jgi:hypothetical protein